MRFPKSKFGVKRAQVDFWMLWSPTVLKITIKTWVELILPTNVFSTTIIHIGAWNGGKEFFFHLLNVCRVNVRVMFTSIVGNKNVSNLDLRLGIVHGLLSGWERNATHNLRCYIAIELAGQQHYPGQNPNGKKCDCIVCSNRQLGMRKQTKMICKQCTKPMCVVPCFEKYHTTWL